MAEPVEIGMLCYKSGGHSAFRGEIDYGVCGSKGVGAFTLSLNVESGRFNESELLNEAAEYIAEAIKFYSEAREKQSWDEYEASGE